MLSSAPERVAQSIKEEMMKDIRQQVENQLDDSGNLGSSKK
jgi:hypothetical protein